MEKTRNIFYIHKHSIFKRYILGALVTLVVLLINAIVKHFFPDYIPMTLFLGPVVIAAWFGGLGVGIFVTLFGAIIENTFYSSTSYFSASHNEAIRTLIYLGQGVLISLIFGEVHQIQKTIAIREEQLSEALKREKQNVIEKEEMLEKLNQTQQLIIAERRRAEDANELKSLFLAHMSHEIRTPLVSVLGFAELLKEPDLTLENAKKYGGIIERTGQNLLNIINDILDLSKVEAGYLEIEKIPFSIQNLVSEVRSTLLTTCQQKKVTLEMIPIGEIPSIIVSDPTRLRQILLNLIGNAIKFTEKGFVKIRYFIQDNNCLIFNIRDSGIGISAEQQLRLFESFSQADRSIARRYAGTGLGLSLSKKLASKLGGDVQLIESQPNLGSQFQLKICFETSNETESISNEDQKLNDVFDLQLQKNKTILLVDDSVDNQFLVQTILSKWGFLIELASNGKEALEKVKTCNFDLILMDMQMPIMDGYTACAQLIAESCKIPIIALTANAMKEDRDRCLQAGCKDYLSKPIQKTQLLQIIQKNLSA